VSTGSRTRGLLFGLYLLASLADPDAPPARALRAWRILRGDTYEVPFRLE